MKPFKIRKNEFVPRDDIVKTGFEVEIEFLNDGEREKHIFPLGEGWEDLEDGEPKYYWKLIERINDRVEGTGEIMTKIDSVKGKKITKFSKPKAVNKGAIVKRIGG